MRGKAHLNLRYSKPDRIEFFRQGFARLGYEVSLGIPSNFGENDVACLWNRIGQNDEAARQAKAQGAKVLIVENASFGTNYFAGEKWLHVARDMHNLKSGYPIGDNSRWDLLGVRLPPYRKTGETVLLLSRGFGNPRVAMPSHWPRSIGNCGRVRTHPGTGQAIPLEKDLANARKVIVWGSAAGVQATMMGIECESHLQGWIGECVPNEESRLNMLRWLVHGQHRITEIQSGEAMARLLT